MKRKKIVFLGMILCLYVPLLANCGQAPQAKVEVVEMTAREERMQDFNNQLTNISDESSAATAITSFADYVEGTSATGEVSVSAVRIFSNDTISQLAKLEVRTRQVMAGGISATAAESEGLITVDKVTEAANLAKDSSVTNISSDEIAFIQAGVRSELPGIVPTDSNAEISASGVHASSVSAGVVTPIEALVIGYVMASGDDGSADPGENQEKVTNDKVGTYVENIIE
ncbi:MAG: hypothetical protein WC890_06000 [Candidatus Margulisiibacteriota bacterium]